MSIPAIIVLCLYALALISAGVDHGKIQAGVVSFWITLVIITVHAGLLYWGGFFD